MEHRLRGVQANLADAAKAVIVMQHPEEFDVLWSIIETGDAFVKALQSGEPDDEVIDAFLDAMEKMEASETSTRQHPDVVYALAEVARAEREYPGGMERVRAVYGLLATRLSGVDTYRAQHNGDYPVLPLVGLGSRVAGVRQRDDGEEDVLRGKQLRPKYTAPGVLAPCEYRAVITLAIRRHQFLGECIRRGAIAWDTHRAEKYSLMGLEDFETKCPVDRALKLLARWLDTSYTARDLLVRKAMTGALIAASGMVVLLHVHLLHSRMPASCKVHLNF